MEGSASASARTPGERWRICPGSGAAYRPGVPNSRSAKRIRLLIVIAADDAARNGFGLRAEQLVGVLHGAQPIRERMVLVVLALTLARAAHSTHAAHGVGLAGRGG